MQKLNKTFENKTFKCSKTQIKTQIIQCKKKVQKAQKQNACKTWLAIINL